MAKQSDLRRNADRREIIQHLLNSQTVLTNWLRRNGFMKSSPSDDLTFHWSPAQQEIADTDTIHIAITKPQRVQLPITGDIDMGNVPQTDPHAARMRDTDKRAIQRNLQERVKRTQDELITRIQSLIARYYYAHGEKMPKSIEMSASDRLILDSRLIDGKYFPETRVEVISVKDLRDIICKPEEIIVKTENIAPKEEPIDEQSDEHG